MSKDLKSRLISKITIDNNQCWNWCGQIAKNGYGKMSFQNRKQLIHRISWIAHNGDIPNGILVLHKCDNRRCLNPKHLFLGTHKDNTQDMCAKGRHVPYIAPLGTRAGSDCPTSKLSWPQARKIRKAKGTMKKIAEKYKINSTTVWRIKHNINWKEEFDPKNSKEIKNGL